MLKYFPALVLLLLSAPSRCYGQFNNLLNKKYADRAPVLWEIYSKIFDNYKVGYSDKVINQFEGFCYHSKDPELVLEAKLMHAVYMLRSKKYSNQQVIDELNKVIKLGQQAHVIQIQARALKTKAQFYWETINNYELSFETYQQENNLINSLAFREYPEKVIDLYLIGNAHYEFADYYKAVQYYKQVINFRSDSPFLNFYFTQSYNSLGLAYIKIGQLDSARIYFNKLRMIKAAQADSLWVGIVDGNLGNIYFLQNKYDKAVPLFQNDIKQALRYHDWGLASGSSMLLAAVYLHNKQYALAEQTILKCQAYVIKSGQYQRYAHLYPLLSKLYAIKGEKERAAQYLDSAIIVKDSLARKFNALQMLRAQQKIDLQDYQANLTALENQKKIKTLERNIMLGGAIAILISALYIYINQRKKHRYLQALKDHQLLQKQSQLSMATIQLEDFTRNIIEKNSLIDTLQQRLENTGDDAIIQQLQRSIILTDEDWDKFRELFDQVHKGYIYSLKQKYPNLTQGEVRYMALLKLGFNNKEMGAALGISPESIRSITHRLRKKLDVQLEEPGLI